MHCLKFKRCYCLKYKHRLPRWNATWLYPWCLVTNHLQIASDSIKHWKYIYKAYGFIQVGGWEKEGFCPLVFCLPPLEDWTYIAIQYTCPTILIQIQKCPPPILVQIQKCPLLASPEWNTEAELKNVTVPVEKSDCHGYTINLIAKCQHVNRFAMFQQKSMPVLTWVITAFLLAFASSSFLIILSWPTDAA